MTNIEQCQWKCYLSVVENLQMFALLEGQVLVRAGVIVVESDEQLWRMHPVRGRVWSMTPTHVISVHHFVAGVGQRTVMVSVGHH